MRCPSTMPGMRADRRPGERQPAAPGDISDLLRREPHDDEAVGRTLSGKRGMVTGAEAPSGWNCAGRCCVGGRPGWASWPRREQHLRGMLDLAGIPELEPVPIIADIRDIDRIREVFPASCPKWCSTPLPTSMCRSWRSMSKSGYQQCAGTKSGGCSAGFRRAVRTSPPTRQCSPPASAPPSASLS
jgi:hypothetical protein